MRVEHKEAIERARLHGVLPSVLANELMVHDLVDAALFELRNIHSPYSKLNEGQQQEVITRITDKVKDVVSTAVAIISSRNVITIPCKMKQIQVTEKTLTVTSLVDAKDPSRHGLTDSAGHLCLLVLAPDDYADGLDFIRPDRDQSELALHSSTLTESLFRDSEPLNGDEDLLPDFEGEGDDPLYQQAVQFVMETRRPSISAIQRHLKIGYNRAARMLEAMEQTGIVTPMNTHGAREVLRPHLTDSVANTAAADSLPDDIVDAEFDSKDNEFGDFSYTDAAQLVVLHATVVDVAWLQRRLAIDSDKASTLLLRLLDDNVIKLESEADDRLDNTYTVVGELSALVSLE